MDLFERIFHVSPDRGNGSLELLLFPLAAVIIASRPLHWRQHRGLGTSGLSPKVRR